MFHHSTDPHRVIDKDVADPFRHHAGIQKDDWNLTAVQPVDQVRIHLRSHDGHAIHFAFQHPLHAEFGALGTVARVRDNHVLPVRNCNVFKALYQVREKWIGDVGDDQAKKPASSGAESAGICIGVVIQVGDGKPNPFRRFRRNLV